MRYLAIDYGTRRTGLAICDQGESIASPYKVIEGHKGLVEEIARIVAEEGAGAVVLGLPLNMDGSSGGQAKLVLEFAKELEQGLSVQVLFQDERLSSFAAEEKLAGTELSKKRLRKHADAVAAAEILQAFLEQKNNQERQFRHEGYN